MVKMRYVTLEWPLTWFGGIFARLPPLAAGLFRRFRGCRFTIPGILTSLYICIVIISNIQQ